jgi:hypothetical protein
MSSTLRKRPGYMLRACVAWVILNSVLLFTLAALVYILPKEQLSMWYVMIPLIVAVVTSQWIIMGETIAPIIKDWITQSEYVNDGSKASWEKP